MRSITTINKPLISLTDKDYEGLRLSMIDELKRRIPEYTDLSPTDAGVVIMELFAGGLDNLHYYLDIIANEVFLPTAQERENVLKHCKNFGYIVDNSTPAKFHQVFRLYPQAQDIRIPKGYVVTTLPNINEEIIEYELDIDLVIPAGHIGDEVDLYGDYIYRVPITQGRTVKEDVIGSSFGVEDQKFTLNYNKVILDSIEIYVDEGFGFEKWTKVPTFIGSLKTDKHYTVHSTDSYDAVIQFGNNNSGKIPEEGIHNIVATYRVGGGVVGNVGANTIVACSVQMPYIEETFNPQACYIPGTDTETIEEAKVKAPASLRSLNRAVTLDDFESVTIQMPEIQLCKAIKSSDYDIEGEPRVIVYILPKSSTGVTPELIGEVTRYLDERRLVETYVEVHGAQFKEIDIEVDVVTYYDYYNIEIDKLIREGIEDHIAFGTHDFGEDFNRANLIKDLVSIQGVRYVEVVNPTTIITPQPWEIPVIGNITIRVTGGIDEE